MIIVRKRGEVQLLIEGKSIKISKYTAKKIIQSAPFVTTTSYVTINGTGVGDIGLKPIIHLQPVEQKVFANPKVEVPDYTELPIWVKLRRRFSKQ